MVQSDSNNQGTGDRFKAAVASAHQHSMLGRPQPASTDIPVIAQLVQQQNRFGVPKVIQDMQPSGPEESGEGNAPPAEQGE